MPALIEASRRHLDQVKTALEDHGVSIEVVYSLDSIERGLSRIELLLPFVDGSDAREPTYEIRAVIAAVGRGLVGGRSFVQLLSDNLRLLARKVIERAGRTGEHYVTVVAARVLEACSRSAAGGGVLTVGTAVAKFFVKWGHWPLFIDGVFSSVVYAGSFIVMQLLGFTLATKQPSMTAAALAGTIRDRSGPGRLDELVPPDRADRALAVRRRGRQRLGGDRRRRSRSTSSGAAVAGSSFLDEQTSRGVIASFDPLGSGTIFFAALTGVLLWMSSLFAGWFENWIVYRRLPEAIEHHRYGKRFGKAAHGEAGALPRAPGRGLRRLGRARHRCSACPRCSRSSSACRSTSATSRCRSGSLTLAMSSLGIDGVGWGPFLWAAVGIAIIGLLNFGVSFALALVVALRARDVPRGERRTLPGAVLRRFVRKPLQFFYPPKDNPADAAGGGHAHH